MAVPMSTTHIHSGLPPLPHILKEVGLSRMESFLADKGIEGI